MTVVGERTWRELQGEACIDMELTPINKKQICTSRAFGTNILYFNELSQTISLYAGICAEKLRKQNSCAVSLMVFIHTNNFRQDLPQYGNNCVLKLSVPSNNTIEIVPATAIQMNLFEDKNREKYDELMKVIDKLNHGFASNKLYLAAQTGKEAWKLR